MEFNPDRWNNLPEAVKDMPGVWGHILTCDSYSLASLYCLSIIIIAFYMDLMHALVTDLP
jgi:hypothetical protein